MEIIGTIGIPLAIVLIVLALVLSLAFPIFNMVTNIEAAKKSLMGIGIMVGIFILAYVTSSSELPSYAAKANVSPSQFKMISAGLNTFLITLTLTVVVLIYDVVKGFVNR